MVHGLTRYASRVLKGFAGVLMIVLVLIVTAGCIRTSEDVPPTPVVVKTAPTPDQEAEAEPTEETEEAEPTEETEEAEPTEETEEAVTLEGRAVLPADTFAPGPPAGVAIAGEYFGRIAPFGSQPVQGISAVLPGSQDDTYFVMSDNGFGSQYNSADYHLRWYEVAVDFDAGTVEVLGYTQLSDPQHYITWDIINRSSRILTGADFDLESFRQAPDGTFWFGDELGPYLLHTDAEGRLLEAPIYTPAPDELDPYTRGRPAIQSPQNPDFFYLPDQEAREFVANLPTSGGFEGMALNIDGTMLYPLLEKTLFDQSDQTLLLIQEFDLETTSYTDTYWFYQTEEPDYAIGDMTALNEHEYLVIERDQNEGEEAAFKRIYLVDLGTAESGSVLEKELVVDLMNITDSSGLTEPEEDAIGLGEEFTFPFVTIESVYPLDDTTLLVINDNNYPFSSGRRPGIEPDNTEFILLSLPK